MVIANLLQEEISMTRVEKDRKKTTAPKVDSRTLKPNGQLIRMKRKALGLTIAAFAHKSGISDTAVCSAEKSNRIFLATLKTIADTLGVDMKELIHPDDPSAHC